MKGEELCWQLTLEFQLDRHNLWGNARTALGFVNRRQAPMTLQRTGIASDLGFQVGRKILAGINLILDKGCQFGWNKNIQQDM